MEFFFYICTHNFVPLHSSRRSPTSGVKDFDLLVFAEQQTCLPVFLVSIAYATLTLAAMAVDFML
jgi:hypothetical protein